MLNPNLTTPDSQRKMREETAKRLGIKMPTGPSIGVTDIKPEVKSEDLAAITPTVTPTVTPTLTAEQQLAAIQKRLLGTLTPTVEETQLGVREADVSKQLADLAAATQAGILGREGQGRGITTGLIRGEQEKMFRQAGIAALPLSAQLANIQAKLKSKQIQRGAAADVATTEMEFETKRQEREAKETKAELAKSEPFVLGDMLLRMNPETGEVEELFTVTKENQTATMQEYNLYKQEGGTENFIGFLAEKKRAETLADEAEIEADPNIGKTVKVGDQTLMWNPDTQNYDVEIGVGPGKVTEEDAANISVLGDKVNILDNILVSKNLNKITGTGIGATTEFYASSALGTTQDTILKVQQILSKETIDTLINLKARGGTLGALSDQERIMLQSAATSIGASAVTSLTSGKVIGYQMSEEAFIKEINNIKNITNRAITTMQEVDTTTLDDYIRDNPDALDKAEKAIRQGFTDEEVLEYLQGFKNGGSGTPTATTDVKKISQAIGQYESGGDYKARGPVVPSGQYKGERALGKYQIMPGNLPSWSKAAIGRVVSDQEFLNNPKLQDQIAEHKMGKILAQYGNVEDVASVWFSGRPVSKASGARDVLGTTVPSYVRNVSSIFNRLS